MSRTREILRKGVWYTIDTDAPPPARKTPYIMRDIGAYRSVITGEMIESRSEHRDHLRAHGCIEVGNEFPTAEPVALPPLRDSLAAALQASHETHAEAQAVAERAAQSEI